MELTIKLPDEIAERVWDRTDRDEFIRQAVVVALDEATARPPHLEITPGVAGGKPRIAGRRITVQDVVTWHELLGKSVDEIAADYDLSLAEIHAALTYYFDHREQIDGTMRESESLVESLRSQTPSKLQQRMSERATLRGQED
jgi:uncharacterized protein (DUF433 family)